MPTVSYITPITNRTNEDVNYAREHQSDLINKNIGAWNYTDANRVCNNLKYAAEHMYEQGFLSQPYSMQIKLDWKETDIMTAETLNSMIIDNINNLRTYSRDDLTWYPITSVANMDYTVANWIERDIDALATQVPMPPDTYKLTVENGSGSGNYEAETVVTIRANPPETGEVFDRWSGDHLENIGDATSEVTTYTMPNQDITLTANYTGVIPHTLIITTYTKTETVRLAMGDIHYIEADPAPQGKVFHHWVVEPSTYEKNLYEPAASTHFTMPNEDVTLTAFYITKGEKQLVVKNGNGSGWYEYDTYASVSSSKPLGATFTNWTGDTQYLTGEVTQEYNSVKIPDVNVITITAHWSMPPATNIKVTIVNGIISSTGATEGTFTEGDRLNIAANVAPEGQVFYYWSITGAGSIYSRDVDSANTTFTVGNAEATVTAVYRDLEYYNLTVNTNNGTEIRTVERYEYFSVDAGTAPDGYTFDKWTGDTQTVHYPYEDWYYSSIFHTDNAVAGTYMGDSDRTITATYRPINPHTLTVKQLSGDVTYTQAEFSTVRLTAEDAPEGMRFTGWGRSGPGSLSSIYTQNTVFTFGNGDTTLTPNYVNVWTVTVINGTINGSTSALLDEGSTYYYLQTRQLAAYERFDGWTQSGPGTIRNTAATTTTFTVGNGNVTITANISEYPDKTLTIYWRDPDTNVDTLVSQETYRYGTTITGIEAVTAPNQTTFSAWLGDVDLISPSALASTITINSLTADTTLIATYYYPEDPEYYTLTVYDGYPESGEYAVGSQITVTAKQPLQGWEFYKWLGDTQYFVNPDVTLSENAVIMPQKAITLRAKFNVIGELPTYEVSVTNGTASATYYTGEGESQVEHDVSGVRILIPAGTEVTLTADPDTVGYTFDYWDGNFEEAGVTDIVITNNPTTFTMVEDNIDVTMIRRRYERASVYGTNATSLSEVYPGVYPINGTLQDTDDYHYVFSHWTCVDADGNDCISAIEDPTSTGVSTNITVTEDKDLWIEAMYVTYYRLTVIEGQDTGSGYYYEGETVNTVYANTPTPESKLQFDHWEDPTGVIQNIYDETPTIIMKDTVSTITAVFTSLDAKGNSIAITGADIHDELITRHDSYLINGVYAVGTIVFDKDGCIGVITEVDPDENDDTDDFRVNKLFYGGNF